MASTQAAARKEEAAINELINQTKEARPQDEMLFGGWLYNKTAYKPMRLYAEKIWSGNYYHKYDEKFDQTTGFTQTEKKENGIKAAVVYTLQTGPTTLNEYFYLLAWSDSYNEGKYTRKVYGYTGRAGDLLTFNWEEVEKQLDASTSSCSYVDANTGTSLKAEIVANVVYADFMYSK